ncbi:pyrroline-5-carboxylate reductase [Paenibacillus sp. MY03]|jgi:pyrroline-5-carboxylate reductase|uniref:pyrroline-5-carboxylate reductase n=1 Tax=Paenibacillus sp. MY03 TaxID=302980 RepID=UPI000B3C8B84|nr:pyrroline-5-carboxylate reductase [Paenibacillus sp. MY03]OUS77324.1 pyrroline-5-carboxylate reductase [Paenibacillus sp. MY03]
MTLVTHTGIAALNICFYGAGSMAEAIARGLIGQELIAADRISMLNRSNAERLTELSSKYGVRTVLQGENNEHFLRNADIIFLAMKPKDAAEAIASIRPLISSGQLIVSVIAGLSIGSIEILLGAKLPIVRSMPNTSSTIGLGATGISYSEAVTSEQRAIAEAIFQSIGINAVVDEPLQESVTGISGSGPAYVYFFMEAMMKAATELGLDDNVARDLVVQTVLGAAEMVRTTGEDPAELRRKVTSPNGTTQAAIELMTERGLQDSIIAGAKRSAERAGEIGAAIERNISE